MDIQHTLIWIYLFVCRHYHGRLAATVQRQSNNDEPDFTDEEVLTIYLFGLFKRRETVSAMHEYAEDHFADWFPDLPSYQSYNRRLNRLNAVFPPLIKKVLETINRGESREIMVRLADSMPIMMAKGQRAFQAKVASEQIADVGYCSSKDTYYHGVKLHVIAEKRSDKLPLPARAGLTPGSKNDLQALRLALPAIEDGVLCGDKAYCDAPLKERLTNEQNLDLLTPIKKEKGQETLSAADNLYSQAMRWIRQPIESLFSWIDEKKHSVGRKGPFLSRPARARVGSACHYNDDAAMMILALNPDSHRD